MEDLNSSTWSLGAASTVGLSHGLLMTGRESDSSWVIRESLRAVAHDSGCPLCNFLWLGNVEARPEKRPGKTAGGHEGRWSWSQAY